MWRSKALAGAVVLSVVVMGCNVTGPVSLRTGRGSYNAAIQQTNNEQLLLNLVRLRYRDTPYFLEVASVSTSFDLTAEASAGTSLPESADNSYDLGTGITFSEQPTVTYTPLQGDQFVTQLMSPVDLNTLLLLYHSGWSIERIFRVCVQQINGVENAASASGPTPEHVPQYKVFSEVAGILRELQINRAIEIGQAVREKGQRVVELRISDDFADSPQVHRLAELLGLEKGLKSFVLTTGQDTVDRIDMMLTTRSLMSCMFYLSQGVNPPARDRKAGRVTVTRDSSGKEFDWHNVTGGLMEIQSSPGRPENAGVTVRYRDSWFYISDSDLSSKSTFSLLTQLFALQAGEIKSSGPILTLPVSR